MLVRMPVNRIYPDTYRRATERIRQFPYFYYVYLLRAHIFAYWGLDGLAVGDAYKTLLLIDEVLDDSGEYHEGALEAEQSHPAEGRDEFQKFAHRSLPSWLSTHPRPDFDWRTLQGSRLFAYRLLIYTLTNLGCLRSAWDFFVQFQKTEVYEAEDEHLRNHLMNSIRVALNEMDTPLNKLEITPEKLPDRGFVHRILYPWNTSEPERYSEANLKFLNAKLSEIAPKLRAEITELPTLSIEGRMMYEKQLGLVATDNIAPGEEMLSESSLLTANNRLYDPLCDACSAKLPPAKIGDSQSRCPECHDTVFCSEKCLEAAASSYHPAICDTDADTTAKDPPKDEAADALYFLLVGRALAMSQHQEQNPLELQETRFLWGEFIQPDLVESDPMASEEWAEPASIFVRAPTLPFSFKYNVLYPLNYLEKMDVDVYASVDQFDFWVFEALFAKCRGVASGKVSAQGIPEVSAVHPLWCLANHSCSPNVKWEWSGVMKFWARDKDELVKWGTQSASSAVNMESGIRKGETIWSHYCDINLPVQERREWAQGALGGDCRCERCIWESATSDPGTDIEQEIPNTQ